MTQRSPQGFGGDITPSSRWITGPSRCGERVSTAQPWDSYYRWIEAWRNHPGFDFAIIPDVIDGSEEENPFCGMGRNRNVVYVECAVGS